MSFAWLELHGHALYFCSSSVAAKSGETCYCTGSAKQDAGCKSQVKDVENQDNDRRGKLQTNRGCHEAPRQQEQARVQEAQRQRQEQTALLDYALIDRPTVEMLRTERTFVSEMRTPAVIGKAVLRIMSTRQQGKAYQVRAATISQDAMLFTIKFRKISGGKELTVW